jgi:hypothetical protein
MSLFPNFDIDSLIFHHVDRAAATQEIVCMTTADRRALAGEFLINAVGTARCPTSGTPPSGKTFGVP